MSVKRRLKFSFYEITIKASMIDYGIERQKEFSSWFREQFISGYNEDFHLIHYDKNVESNIMMMCSNGKKFIVENTKNGTLVEVIDL